MRSIRINCPNVTYHLISRFVDREWFLSDDEERETYLRLLGRALRESDWRCLAYALMSSHIHLALVSGEQPLEAWIKRVHSPFARWMNTRHSRLGSLFVRGPDDYAIPPGRVSHVISYIHNNPVRAGVVARARDSSWTSHRAYLGIAPRPAWLDIDEGLRRSDLTVAELDAWVSEGHDDPCRVEIGGLRRATRGRGELDAGTPTGWLGVVPLMARRTVRLRPDPRWFVDQAAAVLGVTSAELVSRSRRREISKARRVAAHAALAMGLSGSDIAAALGVTPSMISQIRWEARNEHEESIAEVVRRVGRLAGI